jgi:hypothetical protein
MSVTEALGFIGSLLMRMMGVLLVVADSVPMGEQQRDYIMRQREWYEQQQDSLEIDQLLNEVAKEGGE